ncbi:MAG: restriction endonuclease subunit S, partial [Cyanobium sp.]
MQDWPISKLEDLTEDARPITYGVVKPGPEDPIYGVKFIRGGDIFEGKLATESLRTITHEVSRAYARTLLKGGELVVSLVGNPGHVAIIPKSLAGANLARQAGLVALRLDVDAHFVKYFLMSPLGRAELFSQMTGSVQVVINLANLRGVRIPLPPLPIQRRIAGILSAYDDLIENSQRRIKILEEMARRLYREWFVHFRFPGHEGCMLVESPLGEIPEGWEVVDLGTVCLNPKGIQTGPFGSQLHESDYSAEGVPVVMPKDLIDYRIRVQGVAFIPEETAHRLDRHRMQSGDIVYGRRGDIGRRAFIMPHQVGWLCGTGCLRIRPDPQLVDPWYLFNALGQDDVVALIRGRAQGVTMPNLNTSLLETVPLRLPPSNLQCQFSALSYPLATARENLSATIDNLRRTRDLLLPRLLSGQID